MHHTEKKNNPIFYSIHVALVDYTAWHHTTSHPYEATWQCTQTYLRGWGALSGTVIQPPDSSTTSWCVRRYGEATVSGRELSCMEKWRRNLAVYWHYSLCNHSTAECEYHLHLDAHWAAKYVHANSSQNPQVVLTHTRTQAWPHHYHVLLYYQRVKAFLDLSWTTSCDAFHDLCHWLDVTSHLLRVFTTHTRSGSAIIVW